MTSETHAALDEACRVVGLTATDAELIRTAENTLYRLPRGVVARVTRSGQASAAAKEVLVSHWLSQLGLSVVGALRDIEQPVDFAGRAETFWRELPPPRYSPLAELAAVLRTLHSLPPPDFDLPPLAPFVRLGE